MSERLSAADRRLLWICLVIAALSVWVGARNYSRAFPEASIQFRVTRESSFPTAARFLRAVGAPGLDGFTHAAVFGYDDLAKVFLERELGLEKATELLQTRIRLWRWKHRWFRPLQKEELQVEVASTGEVVGFSHLLPEDRPGVDLEPDRARKVAERFLNERMGQRLQDLTFVEATTVQRPRRTDHTFTWKDRRVQLGEASYRFTVTVQGDGIGDYDEYLKIPDQWRRDYEKLRSLNNATEMVDGLLMGLTILALLVVLIQGIRTGTVRWRTASTLGIAGAIIALLAHLNDFPVALFRYETTDSYPGFLMRYLASGLVTAGAGGAAVLLLAAAAEPLYRERYGDKVALLHLFRWQGLRTREFLIANAVGLTLTCFFFAYETVFYRVARRLGAWAPADVPYDNLLSTAMPWAFVLLIGFFPATTEEFLSRMFSIPFCQKCLRSTAIALVVPALIWGFGHAGYPQQPFYIRGVEVGIVGVIAGAVMLRFGIAATLIWHYTTDALFSAFLLLRSGQPYFVLSGSMAAGLMLLPLVLAAAAYRRHGGFVPASDVCNTTVTVVPTDHPEPEKVPAFPATVRLTPRRLLLGALILVLPACFWLLRPERPGSFVQVKVNRAEAQRLADAFLAGRGVDPQRYQRVASLVLDVGNRSAFYLLQKGGVSLLNRTYEDLIPGLIWTVRYFRPLEEEEWQVQIDARRGRPSGFSHTLPETAPGGDLSRDQALRKARTALQVLGVDLAGYELRESTSDRKKARRDHRVVWERTAPLVEEARPRAAVEVLGTEVGSVDRFIKIPESWLRLRQETRPLQVAHRVLRLVLALALLFYVLVVFLQAARGGRIRWGPVTLLSGALALTEVPGFLNRWPLLYENYSTSLAPRIYWINVLSQQLLEMLGLFLAFALCLGTITARYPHLLGMFRPENCRRWRRDAFWCGLLALGAVGAWKGFSSWVLEHYHHWALFGGIALPPGLDEVLPALGVVVTGVQASVIAAPLIGLAAGAIGRLPPPWRGLVLLLVSLALISDQGRNPGEFLVNWGMVLLLLAVVLGGLAWFLRDNPGAYLFSPLLLFLVQDGLLLGMQPLAWAQVNGAILLVLALGVLGWLATNTST